MFFNNNDTEILETWNQNSSFKYFWVVRIEKKMVGLFFGRSYSSTILYWDLITFEALQNRQETQKSPSTTSFAEKGFSDRSETQSSPGLATWVIVFYLTQLFCWPDGAQTNIINEVIGIALTSAKGQLNWEWIYEDIVSPKSQPKITEISALEVY